MTANSTMSDENAARSVRGDANRARQGSMKVGNPARTESRVRVVVAEDEPSARLPP